MSDNPCSVAFHIGVHKTATSHLQKSLLAVRDELAAQGVRYLGPDQLRQPGQTVVKAMRAISADVLGSDQAALHHLLLSEENYIGIPKINRHSPLRRHYPKAATRLEAAARALGRDIDIFMAIRRPTGFLNAVYSQKLAAGQLCTMAQYRYLSPLGAVDWRDLVSRMRAVPGVGRLVVWCYEDYAAHFATICEGLVGTAAAGSVKPLDRRVNSSLSAAAIAELIHRQRMGEGAPLHDDVRYLLPVEEGYPRIDAYSPAEHAAGDAAYRDQIAAIGAMPGVTLLDPLWAADAMRA